MARPLMVLAGAVVLLAVHVYVLSHVAVSAAVLSGVIVLMAIKHLGLLAVVLRSLYSFFQRSRR